MRTPLHHTHSLLIWLFWLFASCSPSSAPMNYPFPTKSSFSQPELAKRFGVVTVEQDPDPAIHYKLIIPLQWGQVSGTRRLVTPEHPFELRSHFKSIGAPMAEAKVTVAYIPEEVSPSDWLAIYLKSQHENVLHERHLKNAGGSVPDVLTSGGEPGHERISRWTVLKDHAKIGGAHFFMLQVSTAANDYTADMANVFFVAISNFDVLHPTGWAYAEQLRTLVRAVPVKFTTAYPLSWQPVENPASDEHFYQIKLLKSIDNQQIGRISLAIAADQTEADIRRLAEEDRAALAEEGVVFEPAQFVDGPSLDSLHKTITATVHQTSAGMEQQKHERTILIGRITGENWVYADCISPARQDAPENWAVSTRAFAILLEHLKIG